MGKRELVLIALFAIVGVVLYQLTAPPPPPGSQGFSVGRIVEHVRRGIRGNRASIHVEKSRIEAVDPAVEEMRFTLPGTELVVVGEERADIAIQFGVTSNGYDEAEAKRLADASALVVTRAASTLVFAMNFPREGRQSASLNLKVPKRLKMRLDQMGGGKLDVSNLSGLEVIGMAGDMSVKNIAGPVVLNQRRGSLEVDGATSLKLTCRGDAKAAHVNGTITVQALGGELTLANVVGPAEIEARNTDLKMESLADLKAPLRIDANNGSVRIDGLRTEARIDGRETELDIGFGAPVAATIYSTGDDIDITPPGAGYSLDAVATDGHITIDDDGIKPSGSESEQRATGAVRGGGPTITLRATRADINVRARPK
jgi:hypothetical protein